MAFLPFSVLVFAMAVYVSMGYLFHLMYPQDKVLFGVFLGIAAVMAILALFATTIK